MTVSTAKIVGPTDGKIGFLGSIDARFMIDGPESAERFSLVEHLMSPRALAAPLHRHHREDEYSFILEGRMGALLGDDVVEAGPGDLVHKPRNQWHTFWNAGSSGTSASSSSSGGLLERHRRTWLRFLHGTDSRSTHRAFPSSSSGSS